MEQMIVIASSHLSVEAGHIAEWSGDPKHSAVDRMIKERVETQTN